MGLRAPVAAAASAGREVTSQSSPVVAPLTPELSVAPAQVFPGLVKLAFHTPPAPHLASSPAPSTLLPALPGPGSPL